MRQYNASYNYFDGMSDAEVEAFQKDALTGHRPTWKVGANSWAHGTPRGRPDAEIGAVLRGPARPRTAFRLAGAASERDKPAERPAQAEAARGKSLEALGLTATADPRGDQGPLQGAGEAPPPRRQRRRPCSEDKLREIIQAYNYLKQAGLV